MQVLNVRGSPNESWETVTAWFIFVSLQMGFMSLLTIFLVIKIIYLYFRKFEKRYLKIKRKVKFKKIQKKSKPQINPPPLELRLDLGVWLIFSFHSQVPTHALFVKIQSYLTYFYTHMLTQPSVIYL